MPATQEFTITGQYTGDDLMPLCLYEPARPGYDALVSAFENQRELESSVERPSLDPVTLQIAPESNMVIGMFVQGDDDTIYRRRPNIHNIGTEQASLEDGVWLQGKRLTSIPTPESDVEDEAGHGAFVLESLDRDGNELPAGWMCGVSVSRTALSGLYIAARNHTPCTRAQDKAKLFDPEFYLSG